MNELDRMQSIVEDTEDVSQHFYGMLGGDSEPVDEQSYNLHLGEIGERLHNLQLLIFGEDRYEFEAAEDQGQ